jgi:hypothetical protein
MACRSNATRAAMQYWMLLQPRTAAATPSFQQRPAAPAVPTAAWAAPSRLAALRIRPRLLAPPISVPLPLPSWGQHTWRPPAAPSSCSSSRCSTCWEACCTRASAPQHRRCTFPRDPPHTLVSIAAVHHLVCSHIVCSAPCSKARVHWSRCVSTNDTKRTMPCGTCAAQRRQAEAAHVRHDQC